MSRAKKPHATRDNVKQILGKPVRPLTEQEKRARTSFYDEFGQNAVAVEPNTYARNPR